MLLFLLAQSAPAQSITQSIAIHPGWNAVWLEVQPEANDTATVIGDLPVAGVWARAERLSPVDFIQNPSEAAFNEAGWLRWLPLSEEASLFNNLQALHANRAYLVKSTNSTTVDWTVTGRPSPRQPDWVPDSYNLRGVPVDPASPPTFRGFFQHASAHYDTATGQLRSVYRLDSASGQWEPVSADDPTTAGRAYWIFSLGASDFVAPLTVFARIGDGLDFGPDLSETELRVRNHTSASFNALVRDGLFGADNVLSLYQLDPILGGQWPALPDPLLVNVPGGEQARLRVAVRRQDLAGATYETVLEVRDGAGTRLLVPVRAEKLAGASPAGGSGGSGPGNVGFAGLWVGFATLDAVSEPHSADPDTPTPTRKAMNLRMILHVDAAGQARLLKEVVQMWRDGTFTNDASGQQVVDRPGAYVLLTDDALIPQFQGALVRDGKPVGRRLSTIGYDFTGVGGTNLIELTGRLAVDGSLTGTMNLPESHPTNPFRHKFHPDHDNLNARFDGPAPEAYAVTRELAMLFQNAPPDGPAAPDFGYNEMGGLYAETVTGVHRQPIHVSGSFRLTRVSLIDALNPNPTP